MKNLLNALALVLAALVLFVFWAKSPVRLKHPFADNAVVNYPNIAKQGFNGTLRVVSYNIGYAYGDANNDHLLPVAKVMQNLELAATALAKLSPDVICLQEVDFASHRTGLTDQLDWLAKRLGFSYVAYDVNWNKTYVPFPYWPPQNHFRQMVSGQAVLSRFPITNNRVHVFAKPPNPFWYNWFYLERTAQEVRLQLTNRAVTLWNVHLEAFHRPTRLLQAKEMAQFVLASPDGPKIVVGDFNDPNILVDKPANGKPNPDNAASRFLAETKFTEAMPAQDVYTFPSWAPVQRLDHITFSNQMTSSANGTLNVSASDHLPVWADLKM